MRLAGVLGWPVRHSRSPAIHEAAYRALGMDGWRYQLLPVPPALLAETARALPAQGFVGANVTIPHKRAALALADEVSPAAGEIGAANTLTFAGGRIAADNTDGPALEQLIRARAPDGSLRGRDAIVLGAGGSARAAIWALRALGVRVSVWNRSPERAQALAEELGATAVGSAQPAHLLVNCTPIGQTEDSLKGLPLSVDDLDRYSLVIDLAYSVCPTPLVAEAATRGCAVVDGLEVLVTQAGLSFQAWTGRNPPVEDMRAAARAQ